MTKIKPGQQAGIRELEEIGIEGLELGQALLKMFADVEPQIKTPAAALAEAMIDHFNSILNYTENQEVAANE